MQIPHSDTWCIALHMGEGAHSLPVAGIGAAEFDIDPRPVPLPGRGMGHFYLGRKLLPTVYQE